MQRSSFQVVIVVVTVLALLTQTAAHAQQREAKLDQLLAHVAPEAQVIIAIPSLKRLNDDITELLGGMDRADMVAAGRPIDLVKSLLGLGGGIDDRRGAAIVLVPGEDAMPTPLALLAVIDQEGFLETNFKYDEAAGTYTGTTGAQLYIRKLTDNYMLLSEHKEALEAYNSRGGATSVVEKRFGGHVDTLLKRGEMLVLIDQSGARLAAADFALPGAMARAGFPADPEAAARMAAQRERIISQTAGLAYVLDVDPLGVMLHGVVTFEPGSELAGALHEPMSPPRPWTSMVPGKRYYIAAGVDLKSAGALQTLEAVAPMFQLDIERVRDVLTRAQQVAFIASPSPAGVTGGFLNDAALVIRTTDPQATKSSVREAMERITAEANERLTATMPEGSTARIELKWSNDRLLGDTELVADAYEVHAPAGGDIVFAMTRSIIFGRNQRGFIGATEDAVIVTFSQRPAVFAAAMAAAKGEGERLADDDVLESVRQWMGGPAPVEVFFSLGQLNKFALSVANSFMMGGEGELPELDPKGPPVALTFGVGERSLTSQLALPAPVLSDLLREFERSYRPFTGGGADPQ